MILNLMMLWRDKQSDNRDGMHDFDRANHTVPVQKAKTQNDVNQSNNQTIKQRTLTVKK